MVESYHMKNSLEYILITVKLMSHKKRIKESLLRMNLNVINRKITNTFFKSVCSFRELGNHAKVLIVGSRNHGQRKDNAEARRRFLSLINFLLTITNFERRFTNDYITYRERNSERVQCIALEIKTRPIEQYWFSLC